MTSSGLEHRGLVLEAQEECAATAEPNTKKKKKKKKVSHRDSAKRHKIPGVSGDKTVCRLGTIRHYHLRLITVFVASLFCNLLQLSSCARVCQQEPEAGENRGAAG